LKSVLYLACPAPERADTEQLLAAAGVSVVWADTVAGALNELQRHDLPVLVDLSRGATALQIARDLRTHRASTLMFAVVDARRPDLTIEAVLAGMADVFARPLGGRRVANAIDRERAYETAHAPCGWNDDEGDLYSHSATMRDVMVLIGRAATMRAGVLIRGEDGTGRQLAARAIHAQQNGHGAQFVTVDCAAHDADELDLMLFGKADGSAQSQSKRERQVHDGDGSRGLERLTTDSKLFVARGGTLYLQHVVEAPSRVQVRLARVLRDREGIVSESGETIGLDVRPMASVDPAIDNAVQEGRIRDDLFRRLSVIRIDMPSLRSRREDIPALANYFLREICASLRMQPKALSRSALSLLAAMPWRGNAAELRTLLESVIPVLQNGRAVGLEDLLGHIRLDGGSVVFANGGTLKQARSRFEREYIASVLEQHHGRISEAAKALGIQRTNLYRKMRSLRVTRTRR
jgi:two-component system nitrogen regulation response regulator NtrX